MIPKIIHYVWLGDAPLPEDMQKCMDSWKKWMPDYQWMRWDDEVIQNIDYIFIREALEEKKWAFASDVIRLYAIHKYGGIYMDTDVMVYRSFDPLLQNKAFIGRENSMHQIGKTMEVYLTTCCFGAEPGNPFIKRCLDYYEGRHFITSQDCALPAELRLDVTLNSKVFCVLAKDWGFNASVLADYEQHCKDDVLTIYPKRFFDATKMTADLYTRHLALGTWREGKRKEEHHTLRYKIEWRIRYCVEWVLRQFDYVMIRLM